MDIAPEIEYNSANTTYALTTKLISKSIKGSVSYASDKIRLTTVLNITPKVNLENNVEIPIGAGFSTRIETNNSIKESSFGLGYYYSLSQSTKVGVLSKLSYRSLRFKNYSIELSYPYN